jgi:hypothetical protein
MANPNSFLAETAETASLALREYFRPLFAAWRMLKQFVSGRSLRSTADEAAADVVLQFEQQPPRSPQSAGQGQDLPGQPLLSDGHEAEVTDAPARYESVPIQPIVRFQPLQFLQFFSGRLV